MPGRKPTLVNVDCDVMTVDEAAPKAVSYTHLHFRALLLL